MTLFRKKPIEVEATQWFKNGDHPQDNVGEVLPDPSYPNLTYPRMEGAVVRYYRMPPLNEAGEVDVNGELNGQKRHSDLPNTNRPDCHEIMHDHGWIDTIEGGHTVCPSDWIITGVQGEVYPCKADIFEATYEPVEDDDSAPHWWLSWYHDPEDGLFGMYNPWWISGYDEAGRTIVVAAIEKSIAPAEYDAWDRVQQSYDTVPEDISRRFIEEREGSPFSERFPRSKWYVWKGHSQEEQS